MNIPDGWKLPTQLTAPWLTEAGLTDEAQRVLRAYNDLGYVPHLTQAGTITQVTFKQAPLQYFVED